MNGEQQAELVVPADHPSLAGHFPGNPIVPGVVLIDLAVAAIRGERKLRLAGAPNLKFLRPVLPGERVTLYWRWHGELVRFRCVSGEFERVQGSLSFTGDAG
ncbi:MAG TPA: hypothetical protein VM074_00530 [Solimonas sp.]|nr:hypothetical protein [Solimonas sp.]